MSIPVELADLARALDDFGAGYLVSANAQGVVKVVTVEPEVDGETVRVSGPGRGTLANVAANPSVTLVFPPLLQRGFTLLVDGTAISVDDDVVVRPSGAVLHRPRIHADGPPPPPSAGPQTDACGNECAPVQEPE